MKKPIPYFVIAVLAVSLLASIVIGNLNLFIITLSIYVLYKLLAPKLNSTIFDSKIYSTILVFFCYVILLQCAVLISWLFNHNFPLNSTPSLLLAALSVAFAWNYVRRDKIEAAATLKTINLKDSLSLLIAFVVSMLILIAPIFQNPDYIPSTIAMSLIDGNVDDSAHISLINDRLQFDRGVTLGSNASGKTRNSAFYPAGWHSISAVFIKTFSPNIKTGTESIWAYGIQKLFWVFLLFFLFTRVTFTVFGFISGKKIKDTSYLWISGAASLFSCMFLLPISREGFYSFLPQLIAALLIIPLIVQLCLEKNTPAPYRILPAFFLVCFGGCLAWFLPLPAFSLAALLIILAITINKNIGVLFKNIWAIIKDNLIILTILFTAIITQFYIMSSDKTAGAVSFLNGVVLDGGIAKYDNSFYIALCLGFIMCLIFANKKAKKSMHLILALIASILLYCIFIHLIQIKAVGMDTYYFYKTLDILVITVLPLSIAGLGMAIKQMHSPTQKLLEVSTSIVILAGSVLLIGPNVSVLAYGGGFRNFSPQVGKSLMKELDETISEKNYYNKKYIFYYATGGDFLIQNEVANIISKSNEVASSCFDSTRSLIYLSSQINTLLAGVKSQCSDKGYSIDIITNQTSLKVFSDAVKNMGLGDSIKIKTY